ncbi:Nn.00g021330.m01.CDS01 [Neocucurbitaria sp. VM-36]
MELNGFELFAFLLCSCLFGTLFSTWATTDFVTDREIALLIVVFAAVALALSSRLSSAKAITQFLSRHTNDVQDKQLADVKEAHRRRIAALKYDHQTQLHQLQGSLNTANAKFDRLHHDYDWMSGMYQDQMRSTQEQEDRITYLEVKLREFGQLTPGARLPYSAPPGQINFSNPPRRDRTDSAMKSPAASSPLKQVVEAEED